MDRHVSPAGIDLRPKQLTPGASSRLVWREWLEDVMSLADTALGTSTPTEEPEEEVVEFLTAAARPVARTEITPARVEVEKGVILDPPSTIRNRFQAAMKKEIGLALPAISTPPLEEKPCRIHYYFDTEISQAGSHVGQMYVEGDTQFLPGMLTRYLRQEITADDLASVPPDLMKTFSYETEGNAVRWELASS